MENEILSVKIENTKPIELLEFTNTVLGINNIYKIWAKNNGLETCEHVLYIEELKEGSKIVDFIRKGVTKIFKDTTFKFFVSFYKEQIDNLLKEKFDAVEKKAISSIKQSLTYNKNDMNSKLEITAKESNIIHNTLNINGVEASVAYDLCNQILNRDEKKESIKGVILMLKQAENSSKTKKIDRGIIEEISTKTVSVIYKENIKQDIVMDKDNFFKMWFLVDVEVKRVEDKVVAYVITRLYDKGKI